MVAAMRFQLNAHDVIQETVDGEALIIHTPSGTYYSVVGTGEQVWNALLAGHTAAEIAAHFSAHAAADTTGAVENFTRELQEEGLLLPSDATAPAGPMPPAVGPFATPVLQKFTDMQELLLVDPIHEVDPQVGWPARNEPN